MTDTYDKNAMRGRLTKALENAGISMREASLNAGASPGYVYSITSGDADPGTIKLANLCEKNGISFSYVLFGFEISPESERLMSLFEANPEQRANILALISR